MSEELYGVGLEERQWAKVIHPESLGRRLAELRCCQEIKTTQLIRTEYHQLVL